MHQIKDKEWNFYYAQKFTKFFNTNVNFIIQKLRLLFSKANSIDLSMKVLLLNTYFFYGICLDIDFQMLLKIEISSVVSVNWNWIETEPKLAQKTE
jgi:CMP-N-acetylneuraminic acid synthetase